MSLKTFIYNLLFPIESVTTDWNGLTLKTRSHSRRLSATLGHFGRKWENASGFQGKSTVEMASLKKVLICVQHWNVRVFISLFVELVQKSNLVRRKTANRKIFKLYLLSSRNSFFLQQFWWSASLLTVCKDQVKQTSIMKVRRKCKYNSSKFNNIRW